MLGADGDAAAVVDHLDDLALFQRNDDLVAVAGKRLVDRIVNDLIDQMMQPAGTGRADIHTRSFSDGLQPLKDLDLIGAVIVLLIIFHTSP